MKQYKSQTTNLKVVYILGDDAVKDGSHTHTQLLTHIEENYQQEPRHYKI